MARPQRQTLRVTELLGMNTSDPETSLLPGQAREINNVDLLAAGLGEKRAGFMTVPANGTPPTLLPRAVLALHKHSPFGSDATAELWVAVSEPVPDTNRLSATIFRWSAGAWSSLTLPGLVEGNTISFATFNQKLFIAYDTFSANRLHVWDGLTIRRVGLAPPAVAPVLVSLGPGALNFTRFYRARFTFGTQLFSEAGPSASITIAAAAGVLVARPPTVDGIETNWFVEASNTANGPWFQISGPLGIGTTLFNDTNATIPTTFPAPEAGLYTLPPSAKYLAVYQNQLIMAGAYELTTTGNGQTVPKNNRVWFTRPLGALDISDDEAITSTLTQKFWVDTGEDDGRISALSYPLNGIPYVMKPRQVWSLIPTDSDTAPFRAVRLTDSVGCPDFRTLTIGEDERGDPALYWNSTRGPYRMVRAGLQYLGRDFENNRELIPMAVATWMADLRQVWWSSAGFGSGVAGAIYKFNVRFGQVIGTDVRNGWTRDDLSSQQLPTIRALGSFNAFFSSQSEVVRQEPIVAGLTSSPSTQTFLWQRDRTLQQDAGGNYRGRIVTAAYTLGDLLYNVLIYPPRIYAEGALASGLGPITLACTPRANIGGIPMDLGVTNMTSTVTLGSEPFPSPVVRRIGVFEGIQWSDAEIYQFTIGDENVLDTNQGWRIFAFLVPWQRAEEAE